MHRVLQLALVEDGEGQHRDAERDERHRERHPAVQLEEELEPEREDQDGGGQQHDIAVALGERATSERELLDSLQHAALLMRVELLQGSAGGRSAATGAAGAAAAPAPIARHMARSP